MIYKFFVAPGSAFEVSVSHRRRKQTEVGVTIKMSNICIASSGNKSSD
jgi:hypothetical protein